MHIWRFNKWGTEQMIMRSFRRGFAPVSLLVIAELPTHDVNAAIVGCFFLN